MSESGVLRVTYQGRTLTFNIGEIVTIGRHPDSAVMVMDSKVSRHHVEVRYQDGLWVLEDLGSSNGTFLGGEPLSELELSGPVKVNIGAIDGPSISLVPEVVGDTAVISDETVRIGKRSAQLPGSSTQSLSPGAVRPFRREPTVTRIGRSPANDVVIDEEGVSWFHAEMRISDDGPRLVDLNSHNGTFVNGRKIEAIDLAELDLVTIGAVTFRFVSDQLEPMSGVEG